MASLVGGGGAGSGEAWLPADFWSDEMEPKMVKNCGSYEWGRQGDSNLSSPVGLSETDDEDDYVAGLAQRVAYAMLDDDDDENCCRSRNTKWVPCRQANSKGSFMGRSPQSTLAGVENLSSKTYGGFSSPVHRGNGKEDASAWLLLHMAGYNAAGLERGALAQANHRTSKEVSDKSYLRAAVGELGSHCPSNMQRSQSLARKEFQAKTAPHLGFENAYNGLPAPRRAWNPRPKDDEQNIPVNLVAKQCLDAGNGRQGKLAQTQNRGVNNRLVSRSSPGYMGGGSGMRAVFLGSNGPGRESGGTGVFLPRRMDNGYTAKSKPACSTVLLPARIVQALNLNVEDLRSQPCGLSEAAHNRRDYAKKLDKRQSVGGDIWPEQKQQQQNHNSGFFPGCYESQHPSSEITLPQEWTY